MKEGRKEGKNKQASLPLKIGAVLAWGAAAFLKAWFHFWKPEYLMDGLTQMEARSGDKILLGAVLKSGVYF